MSKDERMAFEKIISEIGKNSNTSDADTSSAGPETQPPDDELDDDQQAALDKIMSEINGDGDQEAPATETDSGDDDPEPDAPQPDDELNEDQQAALDKIMAEINGDGDDASPETDMDADSQAPDAESDAVNSEELASAQEDDAGEAPEKREAEDQIENKSTPAAATSQLSLEEFNEELNNLLSAANANPEASPSPDASPSIDKPAVEDDPVTEEQDVDEKVSEGASADETDAVQDYAILHEVSPTADRKPPARRTQPLSEVSDKRKPVRKILCWAAAAVLVICLAGGAYWFFMPKDDQPLTASNAPPTVAKPSETPGQTVPVQAGQEVLNTEETQPGPSSLPPTQSPTAKPAMEAPLTPLASLKDDITAAREEVVRKLEEVKDLKSYYEKGIAEDQDSIRRAMASSGIVTFKAARQQSQIELRLRTIQRRRRYAAKLDSPIRQLTSASEELLFLKRKTDMFETLSQGLSGLALPEFSQEVSTIIGNLLKLSNGLDIDKVQVKAPDLESIWKDLQSSKSGQPESRVQSNVVQDRNISQEICRGDFERKYLLTTIEADTAKCLANWSGKDLYLNALTQLSPSVAEALSQWPGEWLSLNGLEDLTPETAKYLSRWNGKRLSLNGLKHLSKSATRYLSEWKGEQLEMVGLESIGRWENYGTRLYLSEKLQRKLQVQ